MKKTENAVVRFEISEPLAFVLGITAVCFFATLLTVGGCWVDSHHKVEAIKASNRPMEVYETLNGRWHVRETKKEN